MYKEDFDTPLMDNEEPSNLGDALVWQITRVGKIRDEYLQIPGGAGQFAAEFMRQDIAAAILAQGSGNIVAMLRSYEKLKEYEL